MATAVRDVTGRSFTLKKPAIEVAVAELRFPPNADVVTQEAGLAFRDHLRDAGYVMDGFESAVTQDFSVEVTQTGGQTTTNVSARGWQLKDNASGLAVVLMPSSLVVQTNRYSRWSESLEPVLLTSLALLPDLLEVSMRTRVGLRYVNRFSDPTATSPSAWATKFDETLLGPISGGPLREKILSSHQQLELDCGAGVFGVLRHGAFVDSAAQRSYSYLLDIDVFNPMTERFDADTTGEIFKSLNREAASILKDAMSRELSEERGMVVETEQEDSQ